MPTPICLGGATVSIDPGDSILLKASMFDNGSFDNITSKEKLKFYFDLNVEELYFTTIKSTEIFEIKMFVEDEAGNSDNCFDFLLLSTKNKNQTIGILDSIPPNPFLQNFVYFVINSSLDFTLPAETFNYRSFDNVSPKEKLRYTFGPDPNTFNRNFTCYDIGQHELEIFVWDEAGNFRSAVVTFNLVDLDLKCVEVELDTIPPVAKLHDPLPVDIRSDLFTEYIYPSVFDNGSYDNESGIKSLLFDNGIYQYKFGCNEIGIHPVSLLLSDKVGNQTVVESSFEVSDPNNYCSLGINKKAANSKLQVFPNPVTDEIFWFSDEKSGELKLLDFQGRQIFTYAKKDKSGSFNIENLPSGFYILMETNHNHEQKSQIFSKI